jgi:hypothetical protein
MFLANKQDRRLTPFRPTATPFLPRTRRCRSLPRPYQFARRAYRSLLRLRCGRFSRSLLFAPLARNDRLPPFRDLVRDLFKGCRLSAPFETPVARLIAFPTGRRSDAAFPTRAPTTPPTTAPIGPTMLPIAAPVTAPAVCFGIGGIWKSLDDGRLFFSGFGWSGINGGLLNIFDSLQDIRMTKWT